MTENVFKTDVSGRGESTALGKEACASEARVTTHRIGKPEQKSESDAIAAV